MQTTGDRKARRWAVWLLATMLLGWLGLIVLAPLAQSRGSVIAPFLYSLFAQVCHQIPERSWSLDGHPWAVCHRCSGIYLGALSGLLASAAWEWYRSRVEQRPRLILLGMALILIDVFLIPNTVWTRVATGFLAAFLVAPIIVRAAESLLGPSKAARTHKDENGVRVSSSA